MESNLKTLKCYSIDSLDDSIDFLSIEHLITRNWRNEINQFKNLKGK